ncbi:retrovirus-related pol polyprotein from transposon TNT 1-94 [Tanacetum coccineum]
MRRSSTKELLSPFENPEQKFRSRRRLFDTPSLIESNSPEFDHIFDSEEQSEEEVRETMTETMEQYMSKTRGDYGSGVTRPTINQDTHFELKGKFLKELRYNTLSVTQDQIMPQAFHVSLTGAASRWLRNQPPGSITTWEHAANPSSNSTITYEKVIESINDKLYAAQVGCELCKGPHYTKDCPQKEEGKNLEEAYYTQFSVPYQPGGQYRAVGPGFYQLNNGHSSYLDRRTNLEESPTKFMAESTKRHEENSKIIMEI